MNDKTAVYVYVVTCDDPWLDYNYVEAVFEDKEDAECYLKLAEETEPDNYYKVEAVQLR